MMSNKMDEKLGVLTIKPKLLILAAISLAGMALISIILLNAISKNLYYEREMQIEKLVDTSYSIVKHFYNLQQSGQYSKNQAQSIAMDTIKSVKYGKNGYFWINDTDGIMLMHPYTPQYVGKSVLELTDINGKHMFVDFIKTAKAGGGFVDYYWPKPGYKEGSRKMSYVALFKEWNWVLGTGIYLDDIEKEIESISYRAVFVIAVIFIVLSLISIFMSKHFLNQLCILAMCDSLTSLLTRRGLSKEAKILVSNHDREIRKYLAIIFLDIDFFKKVNDIYGHAQGDNVLANVGKSILKSIRTGDIGARYGGEEFVIVMLCDEKEDAVKVASRIRASVNEIVFESGDKNFSVTLSGGIAFREENENFEHLLKRADKNLYEAKESGRDRLCY